ncbi:MAG: helix-turn-helix domain-containing protein [Terriglobales bacterium]
MSNLHQPASFDAPPNPERFMPEIHCGTTSLKEITRQATQQLERQLILRSLEANHWNRRRVARELRISYRALLYKIRDAGINPPTSTVSSSENSGGMADTIKKDRAA